MADVPPLFTALKIRDSGQHVYDSNTLVYVRVKLFRGCNVGGPH